MQGEGTNWMEIMALVFLGWLPKRQRIRWTESKKRERSSTRKFKVCSSSRLLPCNAFLADKNACFSQLFFFPSPEPDLKSGRRGQCHGGKKSAFTTKVKDSTWNLLVCLSQPLIWVGVQCRREGWRHCSLKGTNKPINNKYHLLFPERTLRASYHLQQSGCVSWKTNSGHREVKSLVLFFPLHRKLIDISGECWID